MWQPYDYQINDISDIHSIYHVNLAFNTDTDYKVFIITSDEYFEKEKNTSHTHA